MLQPRIGIGIALAFCLLPLAVTPAGEKKDAAKNSYFKGSVVALARLLEKQGLKLDDDAVPHWLVLKADDGKIYPLVKDDGSRMFFKDAKLLIRFSFVNKDV